MKTRQVTGHAGSSGQTSVEFALASVVFFTLVFGAVEIGRLVYGLNASATAAREGARWAVASANTVNPDKTACEPSSTPGMISYAQSKAPGIPLQISVQENVDAKSNPVSCTVTATWVYQPASGFFNFLPSHNYSSISTLYFNGNLK